MSNNTSQQILPTAANLIGFCLFIITSMHITNKAATSLIDELTSAITLSLTIACLFSFLSIRAYSQNFKLKTELVAEYSFIFSLLGILIVIMMLVLGYIA